MRLLEELSPHFPAGRLARRCGQIWDRLQSLQRTIFPESVAKPLAGVQPSGATVVEGKDSESEPPTNWAAALKARGCPVCARLAGTAFHFYARWQHTLIADESAQEQFAARMGFCALHTWQFAAICSPQGLSSSYAKLAESCEQKLSGLAVVPDSAPASIEAIPPTHQGCAACRRLRAVEEAAIRGLADFLKDSTGRQVYHDSQGVCLRHLAQLIRACVNADLARHLLQHAARRFGEMAEDMQNYALKHDGLRRALQNEDEKDAYLRAIVGMVGGQAVCAPWQADGEI